MEETEAIKNITIFQRIEKKRYRDIPGSMCKQEQHKTQRRRRSCSLHAPHSYSSKHNDDPRIKRQHCLTTIVNGTQENSQTIAWIRHTIRKTHRLHIRQ